MSFGIDAKKLKTLVDLYHPENNGQELKYMIHLKGQQELFRNLQTCPFQGISTNSIEDREIAFGKNKLPARTISSLKIIIKALNEHYIYLPILLSIMLIMYRSFSSVSKDRSVHECIFLLGVTLLNWALRALQQLYLKYKWAHEDVEMDEQVCSVVRENKRFTISSWQLTVGDVLEFKQGDVVAADGWLVQGLDVRVVEHYLSQYVEVEKDTLRKCIMDIKGALEKNGSINQKIIELDNVKSYKSSILLSGSTVKAGEGRMIVLCVGKNSKKGEFLSLSRQKLKQNIVKSKISKMMKSISSSLLILSLSYVIVFIAQTILKALSNGSWSSLLQFRAWMNIELFMTLIVIGIPQGITLAIIVSLLFIKARLWFNQQIWVNYCEDITKMAAVTEIFYDREKSWDRGGYIEFWNQQKIVFERVSHMDEQLSKQSASMSEQSCLEQMSLDPYFKQMMKIGLQFKHSQHSQYQSLPNNTASRIHHKINGWECYEQKTNNRSFSYICDKKHINYVTMRQQHPKDNCQILFVKGQPQKIIQICSRMLLKSSGEIRPFTKPFVREIEDVVRTMNKKMGQVYAICYCICQDGEMKTQVDSILQKQMTFLCLVGLGNKKDYNDFEILRKLKQTGVKLILASSKPVEESINRSKDIGINILEEENLTMEGEDLMKLIGGIICFKCKKSFCVCEKIEKYNPKIKNLEEFRRITKYFKVMANANYYHKYSLVVAFQNIGKKIAYMGTASQDSPAQTNSYLSIVSSYSNLLLKNSQVYFPNNSLKCLYDFIIWSRFSSLLVSKIIQFILPANLVAIIIIILGATVFETIPLSIIQILWVSVYISFLTSLNLSWQKPKETLIQISCKSFEKESGLLGEQVKKQVIFQSIFQSFILFLLLAVGHQFLPQEADKVDEIIGSNWQAKYSSASMDKVASGLYRNEFLTTYSYEQTFNVYGIYSRHLTIVFNTYALMQIFNYFNCRKIGAKQINVLEGIQLHNIVVFIVGIVSHFLFVGLASDYANLYPANLTVKQWLVSIGLALLVEMLAFVIRLLPDSSKQLSSKSGWANKSYNLSIKLVGKSDRFYQFDREEDILFKNH